MPIPELTQLQQILQKHRHQVRQQCLGEITHQGHTFPIIGAEIGSQADLAPTVVFVGGVHGVERIGSQVVIAFLNSLLERLSWDQHFQTLFKKVRVAFLPLLNPVGFYTNSRANGNGVDLMRNGQVDAVCPVTPMVGGHRLSRHLPWYRGKDGLEQESQILVDFVSDLIKRSSLTLSLDAHSGFGLKDYLWFPYAGNIAPFPCMAQMFRLVQLFDTTYPYHAHYDIAPQSQYYTTHGDLWDQLAKSHKKATFLPLTLEMGSWLWVKKNPKQLFNFAGFFNPQKPHRQTRILRRHTVMMNFLIQAAYSAEQWLPSEQARLDYHAQGINLWYQKVKP